MKVDLSGIPRDWFLWSLSDFRTSVTYVGDNHEHLAWKAELQHLRGGALTEAEGKTPQEAVDNVIETLYEKARDDRRWVRDFLEIVRKGLDQERLRCT